MSHSLTLNCFLLWQILFLFSYSTNSIYIQTVLVLNDKKGQSHNRKKDNILELLLLSQ